MMYQCKICTNSLGNQPIAVREMMFGTRESFAYFQCSHCGCLQIVDIPQDVSKYYPDNYYSFQQNEISINGNKVKNLIKYCLFNAFLFRICVFLLKKMPYLRNYERIGWLNWLTILRTIRKDAPILDVGCGSGALLQEMNIWGFKNLTGIDPFIDKNLLYSSGIKILKTDISNHVGAYDLIMLHHSFEHFEDPHLMLNLLYKMLNPNGCLLIRIPVSDSFAFRKYGSNWAQIDPPRHFFCHTTRSITLLAKNAGFALEQVVYDSTAGQFLDSEKYCRDVSYYEKMDFTFRQVKDYWKRAHQLNRMKDGDQACFIFRKNHFHVV